MLGYLGSFGRAVGSGLSLGLGRGLKAGGLRAMATTAGIGAAAGIGLSIASDGGANTGAYGATGAAIGAAALPAAGLAAGAFGSATVGAARMAGSAYSAAGGASAIGGAVGGAIGGAATFGAAVGTVAASRVGTGLWNVGKRMVDWDASAGAGVLDKIKFTNPISGAKAGWRNGERLHQKIAGAGSGALINGVTLMGAAAIGEGIKKSWNTIQTAKMGQNMGVDSLTPRTPSYSNNAGATGDLVFALNANRRG